MNGLELGELIKTLQRLADEIDDDRPEYGEVATVYIRDTNSGYHWNVDEVTRDDDDDIILRITVRPTDIA